jgi:hypothetical protein
VIENTKFYKKLVDGHLKFPSPKNPQNGTMAALYVFVGDVAFNLGQDFVKPKGSKSGTVFISF